MSSDNNRTNITFIDRKGNVKQLYRKRLYNLPLVDDKGVAVKNRTTGKQVYTQIPKAELRKLDKSTKRSMNKIFGKNKPSAASRPAAPTRDIYAEMMAVVKAS